MAKLNLQDIVQYVEREIKTFHQKRIKSLDALKLSQILKRKNCFILIRHKFWRYSK
ncbi:MAG: hypothetical protein LBT79_01075 [Elusimicrobiota bacterium]|nr:hypothetical protein [Elusimicrobiota bacterium]